jgi:uroporphyrinogen-III decarboxylase
MKCELPNCEISEGEKETAKRLNMHPEDFHYMMDVHMDVIAELARQRRARYADAVE